VSCTGKEKNPYSILVKRKLQEGDRSENRDVDWGIILKWILKNRMGSRGLDYPVNDKGRWWVSVGNVMNTQIP
jgi:hypothetical protein